MSGANVNHEALEKLARACDEVRGECYEQSSALLQDIAKECNEISERAGEISHKLSSARSDLDFAKNCEIAAEFTLAGAQLLLPPYRIPAVAAATTALTLAINHRKKCEKKVKLLDEAFNIYRAQGRRLKSKLDDTHFELKSLLTKYSDFNLVLNKRLNLASADLEEYFLSAPSIEMMSFDFQRDKPTQDQEKLNDQYKKILEKESFCIDEKVKEKYGIGYSQYNLPIFPSIFELNLSETNLKKDESFHYVEGIKQLQKALGEDQDLHSRFSFDQIEQINKGLTPRGYAWYHDPNPPIGRLQLVNEEMLIAVKTPKGCDLWKKVWKK